MDEHNRYKMLENAYGWAMQVCDPIEYAMRQQALLRTLAHYLLERDKPQPIEEKKDEPAV